MSKKKDMEKLFSENLDRILAGKEVRADVSMDSEMLSALDFARKMSEFSLTPSAQYSTRLKARLLQKLEEQEARVKENRGWSWNILRQPIWQAVVAAFIVILLVSIVWRAGLFMPSTPAPVPASTPAPTSAPSPSPVPIQGAFLTVDAWTGKSTYQPGEEVRINVAIRNISGQKLIIDKVPPILSIMQADTGNPVYTFSAGHDTRTLAPGETTQFTYAWNQLDFEGNRVAGSCYLELEDLDYQGRDIRLNLSQPVRFEILH